MQKSASTICLHFHSLIEYSLLSSINIYSNIICIPKAFCDHVCGNIYSKMLSPSSDNLYNSKDQQQNHPNNHNTDPDNRYGKFIRMFYQIYDVFAAVYNFSFVCCIIIFRHICNSVFVCVFKGLHILCDCNPGFQFFFPSMTA